MSAQDSVENPGEENYLLLLLKNYVCIALGSGRRVLSAWPLHLHWSKLLKSRHQNCFRDVPRYSSPAEKKITGGKNLFLIVKI
jgi:hypothetical protein